MSELNDDKKALKNRKSLEDVDAPLRDQVVEKLVRKLEDLDVGQTVVKMWQTGSAERQEVAERQKAFLDSWDSQDVAKSGGPFKGSSDLHLPMPLWVLKAFHARFLATLTDFTMKARNAASTEREWVVKEIVQYALSDWFNYYQGIEEAKDRWVWNWAGKGEGWLKQRWDCRYSRYIDVVEEMVPGPPQFQTGPDGREVMVEGPPRAVEKEKEVMRKVFEGGVVECVPWENIITVGSPEPWLSDAVIEMVPLTASDLWTCADRKIFRAKAVKKVIEGGADSVSAEDTTGIKQAAAENSGRSQLDSTIDADRYVILEAYLRMDIDNSGVASDVVVWVHKRSGEILRATYLHRINKTGERPYFRIEFHLHEDGRTPMGLLEMLYPLSKELDAHHNLRIDFGLLSVMPFGFYRPTSNIEAEELELSPGALIPVDNPQTDVYFPQMGQRTAFGAQEEAAIMNMVERLTGISDLSLGVIGGQGATRTATGARALVAEASANLDVYLSRLNRGWKRFLKYTFDQLQQRLPKGLEFRVTGKDGHAYFISTKGPEEVAGDFDFEISASSASSNKQIQLEVAREVLTLTSNPLDIQLGIITAANRYEALKNYLQVMGVKDFSRFVNAAMENKITITPEEEAGRVLAGIPVRVTPEMDHEGFLAYFQEIYDNDELLGQFNEQQTLALANQAQQHKQALQALQQMAAQQANAQQMRINGANSQNQAPMAPVQGASPAANSMGGV